jgi:hypothetical protein
MDYDGRFFVVQWENDPDFVYCSWRTTPEAFKQGLLDLLWYSPHRLAVLKVVAASANDELAITAHLDAIAPMATLTAPAWRPNNALLREFIRSLPCRTGEARCAIGNYKNRLLWRIGDNSSLPTRETIIEALGSSPVPLSPESIHRLPSVAIPQQTIYNTLSRMAQEGLVCRPERGLYALTEAGMAFYHKLAAQPRSRKSVRSLRP